MIKTVLLKPEEFKNHLKVTGTRIIEKEVQVEVKTGLFGGTTMETRKEEIEVDVFGLDEDSISKYPKDVVEQIKKGGHTPNGYLHPMFNGGIFHIPFETFARGFGYTLTDFYNKNKITQKNLISLEYCKKECGNSCDITGAYVTWDNKK